jgi:hypothetical protein
MKVSSSLLDIKTYFADENYELPTLSEPGGSVIPPRRAPMPQFRWVAILSSAGTGAKFAFILRTKAASLVYVSESTGETTRPSFPAPLKRLAFTSSLIALGPFDLQYDKCTLVGRM